ncbi:MAG: alpha/beta hydrolase [Ectothiorhodospiraceae bacterium]|nr:lysophospholipase [Paracoccaceae bacterium]MCH8506810.1 alpha/beta hydrolase [Ectothiorhodospiraceae bacterium]
MKSLLLVFALALLLGCSSPRVVYAGPPLQEAALADDHVLTRDGYVLPLHAWPAVGGNTEVVVLALHGFTDYGGGFDTLARALQPTGVSVYAYDQRGFGATVDNGQWPGQEVLTSDARTVAGLLRERYPGTPIYLVGKSMGAAVAILTLTGEDAPPVNGSVLIAPAVWGQDVMPWYQQLSLWVGGRIVPGMPLAIRLRDLIGVDPSDDPEVLAAMRDDPLVQDSVKVEVVEQLAKMMDAALEASGSLPGPSLILYGEQDEVIPREPICLMLEALPQHPGPVMQVVLYPEGYHMLTRYTQAASTHADIAGWLGDASSAIPSGRSMSPGDAHERLCR